MCPRRLLLQAALATLLVLTAPPVAAAPSGAACAPGVGVGLVDIPAGTRDPRAQTYIVDHVAPGSTITRRFQICNGTGQPIRVQLYPGSAEVVDGAFRILEGRKGNELTDWIRVEPAVAMLRPGERLLARATITVPARAEDGERYGVLLAELPPAPNANGVPVASRVGVRIYLSVGPGGDPRGDFVVESLQAARGPDGAALVSALVRNTGSRALDLSGSLTLQDGPSGLSGGPYPASVGTTLAPDDSAPVAVTVGSGVAAGPWTAQLTLRSGLLERRVEARLTFPEPGARAAPVPAREVPLAKDPKVLVPVAGVLIGGIALSLAAAALVAARRRARLRSAPPAAT